MVNTAGTTSTTSPTQETRWNNGIDTNDATATDLNSFILWRIDVYKQKKWRDADLSEYYAEDFHNFTREHFEQCSKDTTRDLRDHLRQYGVYVRKGRGCPIAKELYAAMETELEWPEDDPDHPTRQCNTTPKATPAPHDREEPPRTRERTYGYEHEDTGVRHGYGRELANLAKMYSSNDDKYSGNPGDSFNYKYSIFLNYCEQVDIPREALPRAFPNMLRDLAKDFYFKSCHGKDLTIDVLIKSIRDRFETDEYGRAALLEWNTITLQSIITENPNNKTTECLDNLIKRLTTLQRCLPTEYHHDKILHDKLVNACRTLPSCKYACYKPATTITGLISDLQSSITTYQEVDRTTEKGVFVNDTENMNPEMLFTDRRYHARNDRDRSYHARNKNSRSTQLTRRCFVCGQSGCWSTKHTAAEQEKATSRFKQRVNKRVTQYIADYEDDPNHDRAPDENHDDDELLKDIEALVLDTDEPPLSLDTSSFITSIGTLDCGNANAMITQLADQSVEHALTRQTTIHNSTLDIIDTSSDTNSSTTYLTSRRRERYTADRFFGIMLDSGAAQKSTAGYNQYLAYTKTFNKKEQQLDTSTAGSVYVQFGIGSTPSIGSITVHTPIGHATFHVTKTDTPFLLCLQDMDTMDVYFNNLENKVVCANGRREPIMRIFGHPFLIWGPITASFLTETELRQLHRRFGHPATDRLIRLLERAGHNDQHHRHIVEQITKYCAYCQKHGRSPGRFKFTLRDNDICFNHTIIIDIMYIDGSPVLHVVDEATRFQAARWLNNISAQTTWDALRNCWIDVYVGPPDLIVHDAGTNFTAAEFQQNANSMTIQKKCVPVEAAQSIGIVERYHAPLRRAFKIISDELKGNNKMLLLQMAVKSVNDTAGPDGLIPTLLVFGTYPRMTPLDPPAPSIIQRATAIQKAMKEVAKLYATRQINGALRERNGPQVQRFEIGSNVLVWRVHEKKWTGPFKLLAISGETCTVALPSGPTQFRSTVIKSFTSEDSERPATCTPKEPAPIPGESSDVHDITTDDTTDAKDDPPKTYESQQQPQRQNPVRQRQLPQRYRAPDVTVYVNDSVHPNYTLQGTFFKSRQQEINGLLERGVFEIVDEKDVPETTRIFRTRFVDLIKNEGTNKAFEKSRLVVQAFNDQGKQNILTQAPTIQRASQRLILAIAPSIVDANVYLRDISQAYTQSTTAMLRNVYVRAPIEMELPPNRILRVARPLYGIPEAGTHWFQTYHTHHVQKLKMAQSTYDTCFLFSNNKENGFGLIGLQTDDTLILADKTFAARENTELGKAGFLAKPCEILTQSHPLKFNGAVIEQHDQSITINQPQQIKRIQPVEINTPTSKDQYITQRARGAYIASVCQPEMAFGLSFAAQHSTNPTDDDINLLNRCLLWQIRNPTRGLKYIPLDLDTLKIVAFTDSSFANNHDFSSQIGFIIALADVNNNVNVVHWTSVKSRRVTRSVLASELYAMSLGFDAATTIKSTLDQILSKRRTTPIPLTIFTDSKSLYDCLIKLGTTNEKRLMIDLMCLRQSYQRREITEVVWIKGEENAADAMTKEKCCNALKNMVDTNKLMTTTNGWVERAI